MRVLSRGFFFVLAVFGLLSLAEPCRGADHLDSPSVSEDGRLDINDVYAFQSPDNPENTVFVMTVNPLAGVLSDVTFHPNATYEFNIDTDGDAKANFTLEVLFSRPFRDGVQLVFLQVTFRSRFNGRKLGSRPLALGLTGKDVHTRGGSTLRADVFDDPFFFDLTGFNAGLNFTGDDFFAGANVSAIVLEVPSEALGTNNIGVWGRTVVHGKQFDRMGRPAINTVLVPSELKDAFNLGKPKNDFEDFGDVVEATILALSGDAGLAELLTGILLPDILTVDTSNAAGFLNGRRLEDDVIDAELSLLTNGAVAGDGVDANDVAFLNVFPYLAPAQ